MNNSIQRVRDNQDYSFVALGVREPKVHEIDRREARSQVRVFRSRDGFEAAFRETVVERCREFARNAAPNEWYGVLLGRQCKDDGGRHVVVEGIVPDPDCLAGPGYFETTPESELRTRMTSDALFPDCVLLGWVHSHPHGNARFSSVDRQNQTQWTAPDSLGAVIEPYGDGDVSVYRGPQAEPLEEVEDTVVDLAAPAADATPSPAFPPIRARTVHETASGDPASMGLAAQMGAALLGIVCIVAVLSGVLALRRTATLSSRVLELEAEVGRQSEPFVSTIHVVGPSEHLDPVGRVCVDNPPAVPETLVCESTIK
ncbi:MAG: Mov34/MPN/PAD-1 family protein [Patescibacteria group bacterium]|nr:Mov34/MPN/PAD-1 family protein [Patescibacteria group bacterium]